MTRVGDYEAGWLMCVVYWGVSSMRSTETVRQWIQASIMLTY